MHPRHSATLGRLVDYVEVQHALVATVYEKCRLRKSEERFWQVSLSPIFWVLGIITSIKPKVFILWSNLSRYHAEQQWEEASHLMGHIFKLMRWILVSTCNKFFRYCSRRTNSWPIRFISGMNVIMQVFADHYSSQNPIDVPRSWIWDLPRRTVYFGTSVPTIFRGIAPDDNQEFGSYINVLYFLQSLFLTTGYGIQHWTIQLKNGQQ